MCVCRGDLISYIYVFSQGNVSVKVNFCDYFVAVEVKDNIFKAGIK